MMHNISVILIFYVIMLNFNICGAIEKPQNPFAKDGQDTKEEKTTITTDSTVQKQEFVSVKNIVIATSPSTSGIGNVLCSLVNYNQQKIGLKCNTKEGEGSVANIEALDNGNVDFAIISASIIYDKLKLKDTDSNKDNKKYSFVLSLSPEVMNILVKDTSEIKSIEDMKGKIIDVGNSDSANNYMLNKILEAQNWSHQDLKGIEYIKGTDKIDALCNGKVDVVLLYDNIPDYLINRITQSCEVRIIPIDENLTNKLSASNSFIEPEIIPEGTYLNNPMSINTFGTPILIITTGDFDMLIVYNLAKVVLENINTLKKLYPAFQLHSLKELINNKVIPYHEGVSILYREKKLIDESIESK